MGIRVLVSIIFGYLISPLLSDRRTQLLGYSLFAIYVVILIALMPK